MRKVRPARRCVWLTIASSIANFWHGFLRIPADWAPVFRALWVCAIYIAVPLVAAYLVFLRRDVAGD